MNRWSVSAAILLSLISCALGCDCAPSTFKEQYKSASSVVFAKVADVQVREIAPCAGCFLEKSFVYTLTVEKVVKKCGAATDEFVATSPVELSASCGVLLRVGELWMLNLPAAAAGPRGGERFAINSCQGHRAVAGLTADEVRFLWGAAQMPGNQC